MENKIGLVLSGGGTKGIAEAGAIKFLEENYPSINENVFDVSTKK